MQLGTKKIVQILNSVVTSLESENNRVEFYVESFNSLIAGFEKKCMICYSRT